MHIKLAQRIKNKNKQMKTNSEAPQFLSSAPGGFRGDPQGWAPVAVHIQLPGDCELSPRDTVGPAGHAVGISHISCHTGAPGPQALMQARL